MSKRNKVNKDHYVQAGRLTPDEMAREQVRMRNTQPGDRMTGPAPNRQRSGPASSGEQESSRPRSAPEE